MPQLYQPLQWYNSLLLQDPACSVLLVKGALVDFVKDESPQSCLTGAARNVLGSCFSKTLGEAEHYLFVS